MARGIYERIAIYSQSQLCVSTSPGVLTIEAGPAAEGALQWATRYLRCGDVMG